MKPLKRFQSMYKGAAIMAATLWLGVAAVVIIPKKVKYNIVKYINNMYHKNFEAVHSKAAVE